MSSGKIIPQFKKSDISPSSKYNLREIKYVFHEANIPIWFHTLSLSLYLHWTSDCDNNFIYSFFIINNTNTHPKIIGEAPNSNPIAEIQPYGYLQTENYQVYFPFFISPLICFNCYISLYILADNLLAYLFMHDNIISHSFSLEFTYPNEF